MTLDKNEAGERTAAGHCLNKQTCLPFLAYSFLPARSERIWLWLPTPAEILVGVIISRSLIYLRVASVMRSDMRVPRYSDTFNIVREVD